MCANSSISLDGFISPADAKPHWEGFKFEICCFAFNVALCNLRELLPALRSEELQMPDNGNLNLFRPFF